MVEIEIKKSNSNQIERIIMRGHADYDVHGQDIVCAGASAVVFGSTNALFELTEGKVSVEQDPNGGYFKIDILEFDERAELILNSMIISLQTIEESYQEYIKLSYK